ncbi:LutC/YkgG family protein [Sansalvadorimonas verongulae]|uniref:LutC/YkgG family protein n=1 Tax=Sansalvadorimonas verongulae TaxID=2172824 RepID=UPI0012BC2293|nr:lactate utilization protein [Sansalvadorimonas verongulae]MTI13229.1 lactate utilization protein [Sansalvadorimonas verongulae]
MTTGIEARSRILNHLRDGLGDTQPLSQEDDIGCVADVQRNYEERIQQFSHMMAAAKADVHRTTDRLWPELLEQLLREKKISNLLVSLQKEPGKRLAEYEPDFVLRDTGDNPLAIKDELFFGTPAALTTCRGAIAETGSLVIWPDAQEPRAMSLIPPVHFVLLKARDIHSTFADVIRLEGWATGMPTNALLISGPSKTADIARILAYGAHGPRELVVILVDDEAN